MADDSESLSHRMVMMGSGVVNVVMGVGLQTVPMQMMVSPQSCAQLGSGLGREVPMDAKLPAARCCSFEASDEPGPGRRCQVSLDAEPLPPRRRGAQASDEFLLLRQGQMTMDAVRSSKGGTSP